MSDLWSSILIICETTVEYLKFELIYFWKSNWYICGTQVEIFSKLQNNCGSYVEWFLKLELNQLWILSEIIVETSVEKFLNSRSVICGSWVWLFKKIDFNDLWNSSWIIFGPQAHWLSNLERNSSNNLWNILSDLIEWFMKHEMIYLWNLNWYIWGTLNYIFVQLKLDYLWI